LIFRVAADKLSKFTVVKVVVIAKLPITITAENFLILTTSKKTNNRFQAVKNNKQTFLS